MKQAMLAIALTAATQAVAKEPPDRVAGTSSEAVHASKAIDAVPIGDVATWVSSDDYPAEALRNGTAGVVNFTLAIDEAGKVTDCTVTESSGTQSLDDATCALMMARARFTPARDEQGRPIAARFHQRFHWQLPGSGREIWTLDRIRFPMPKNALLLAQLSDDHSMDAVIKRLKSLGIAFERGPAQFDTADLPAAAIAQVNGLPPTEPLAIPQGDFMTVGVITARKVVDSAGKTMIIPLPSPLTTQAVVSYDIDADGKPSNCVARGETPPWMASFTEMCRTLPTDRRVYSPDAAGRTRHFAMTLQVSITTTGKPRATGHTK